MKKPIKSKSSTTVSTLVTSKCSDIELLFENIEEKWLGEIFPNYAGEGFYLNGDLAGVVFKVGKGFSCLIGNKKNFDIVQFRKDCVKIGSLPVYKMAKKVAKKK